MTIKPEQTLETLLDLARARKRESGLRAESEALLQGLRNISGADDRESLLRSLSGVLHSVIDFEDAFILNETKDGSLAPLSSTTACFRSTRWQAHEVFHRALADRPVAVFDVEQVQEWTEQPAFVRCNVKSALHIGLSSGSQSAILVVTHPEPRHFTPEHVKQAARFAPLASQALVTLGLHQAVKERDRFFQLSLDLKGILNSKGRFQQFNTAWTEILGYNSDELEKRSHFMEYVHPEDLYKMTEAFDTLRATEEPQWVECRFLCRNGEERWLSCSLATYPDEQLFYVVARDITARVRAEQKLAYQARHDPLTGVYNRLVFMDHLDRAIAKKGRQPRFHYAVLFLDLDHFKAINDSHGHSVGDELLKGVSKRLMDGVRKVDIVARLGGDEFVMLITDLTTPTCAQRVAERLFASLLRPLEIQGHQISISGSMGIALGDPDYCEAEEVLRDADIAMYAAKTKGRSQCAVFDLEMHAPKQCVNRN